MSQKGIIQLNEEIQPFSRSYIATKLKEIHHSLFTNHQSSPNNNHSPITNHQSTLVNHQSSISSLEMNELEFYILEFSSELKKLGFDLTEYEVKNKLVDLKSDQFGFDKYNRFRILSYDDNDFGLFVDPVLAYENNNFENGSFWSYSNGIKLHGYYGDHVGFDLQFYDNHFRGNKEYFRRTFSQLTGYEFNAPIENGYDFDRLNANLNFSWESFSISLSKDFNYYGAGESGKLILSNKAPSFPNTKLKFYPVYWLKFSYIHGSLHSQILDSTTFRFNPNRNHISTVEKYFVSHLLSITPWQYLNFSIGESVIYSDKFEPIYLIPFTFFRFADHYLTDPDESAGNAQIFASAWYKNYQLRTKFYASLFIDELSTRDSDLPQAIAYSFGLKTIDPLIPESQLVLEYTRINPYVYSHADSAQTYANYGYELGHWIGSNADEIYASFKKRIIRGLNIDLWYRYIRKGNEEDLEEPRYQKDHTFLWGNKNLITMYGASINYEFFHSLNINATYEYSKSSGGNDYLLNEGSSFKFSVGYGL
jgi:hypothetical protein